MEKIYLVMHDYSDDYEGGGRYAIVGTYSSLDLAKKHLESVFQKASIKCKEHNDEGLKYSFKANWKMPDDNNWHNEPVTMLDLSGMSDYDHDYYFIIDLEVNSLFNEKDVESEIEAHFH